MKMTRMSAVLFFILTFFPGLTAELKTAQLPISSKKKHLCLTDNFIIFYCFDANAKFLFQKYFTAQSGDAFGQHQRCFGESGYFTAGGNDWLARTFSGRFPVAFSKVEIDQFNYRKER